MDWFEHETNENRLCSIAPSMADRVTTDYRKVLRLLIRFWAVLMEQNV